MIYSAINICPKRDSGLCNQLYSLITAICYCIDNKIEVLFVNKFYKSINTDNYCNISEIIDIDHLNLYLSKYHIFIVDSNKFTFNISDALITDSNKNIVYNATSNIKSNFLSERQFNILNHTILIPDINLNSGFHLLIKYQLNNGFFEECHPIVDNKLVHSVNYDFSNLNYYQVPILGKKHTDFYTILSNIKFVDIFINKANDIKKTLCIDFDNPQKINCIHLRLENDFIDHFEKLFNIDKSKIKKIFEDMYIETIINNISETETTIVLSNDFDNNVIKFLENKNYKFITTPKLYEDRELNAIIDLEIGLLCNNKYVFVFESSFSYTLLSKLLANNSKIGICELLFVDGIKNALSDQVYTLG
jgi:hypothetical protein